MFTALGSQLSRTWRKEGWKRGMVVSERQYLLEDDDFDVSRLHQSSYIRFTRHRPAPLVLGCCVA
jgi:hypothetical protein